MMVRLIPGHFGPHGKPKRKFKTKLDAEKFLAEHKTDNKHPYLCDFCGSWHIGTPGR